MPEEISKQWEKWINEIQKISKMQTGRYIYKTRPTIPSPKTLSLHVFNDASDRAWGTCIYLRFPTCPKPGYESHLVYASSRVGPTKNALSIPKMELNGVVLGCVKADYILKAIKIP